MEEIICNLHNHTVYSDGSGSYEMVTNAAIKSGLDVLIITDHNIRPDGLEGFRTKNGKQLLLLVGEEVHDQNRQPQKNHTLVIGADQEIAQFAYDPQLLMDEVNKRGGLTFLAHPFEFALPLINEPDISWVSWEVNGFTGIELWNGLSELKTVVHSFAEGLYYLFMPELMAHSPLDSMLNKWDELLINGNRTVAVGGSDSHAIHFKKGLLRKTVFPYEFHFSAINNHLLISEPLTGNLEQDKKMVYNALKTGSSFVGYDLPASTKGFSFTIENQESVYSLGDTVDISQGATVRIHTPQFCHIRLLHDGKLIQEQNYNNRLICTITEPGYYRVECLIPFIRKQRGWIYSNPIFTYLDKKNIKYDYQ